MNELTREASKQTILEAISFLWADMRVRRRKSLRTHPRPLRGHFTDYLTTVYGSDCEILDHTDINVMPFKFQGVDLVQFKRDCPDRFDEYQQTTEEMQQKGQFTYLSWADAVFESINGRAERK